MISRACLQGSAEWGVRAGMGVMGLSTPPANVSLRSALKPLISVPGGPLPRGHL